jgi:hypothetical protein
MAYYPLKKYYRRHKYVVVDGIEYTVDLCYVTDRKNWEVLVTDNFFFATLTRVYNFDDLYLAIAKYESIDCDYIAEQLN